MIEILFFDSTENFDDVADMFFRALGMPFNMQGSSSNSLGGGYSSLSILGVSVKLELNSYDYEDSYSYMISIYKDRLSDLVVNEEIPNEISKIVARLIKDNMGVSVAHKVGSGLEVFS